MEGPSQSPTLGLADFSDGLEFLLARVPLAWKYLHSPQTSSPTPSRALAHIWNGKGKIIPSGDSKAPEKFHRGHSLSPHGPTLCEVTSLGPLHLNLVPSRAARPEGHETPHTLIQKEDISERTFMRRANIPPQPNEVQETRIKDLTFSLQEGAM